MRRLSFAVLWLSLAGGVCAEQGILVVHVSDPLDRPLRGILIGTGGDGSTPTTDDQGKARIRLAADTRIGAPVTLKLGSQDGAEPAEQWVFKVDPRTSPGP